MTFEVAAAVFERDKQCVASILDPTHVCRDKWGYTHKPNILRLLTLDHVLDVPQIGAPVKKRGPERKHRYRAPSDVEHLVAVCWAAHIAQGWSTGHREEIRAYLKRANRPASQPVSGRAAPKAP